MKIQLKLLAFWVFLLISLISFCHGNNIVTVKVIGKIHCKDCTDLASLGINVFIHCKSRKQETNTMRKGQVDKEGKFSVKLTADFKKDEYDPIDSCFAELQSQNQLTSLCHLPSAQTASVKIHHINTPMILIFSPITCQFKNIHTSTPPRVPPIKLAPPPMVVAPPTEYPIPPTPSPTFQSPRNHPTLEGPTPAPIFQSPNPTSKSPYSPSPSPIYITPPPFSNQLPTPPPKAFHQTPSLPAPIPPITSQTPITSPTIPMAKPPTPFSKSPSQSPNSYPPLNRRKSNPIPRAPPIPQLPRIPPVSRKYFNSPNSQPPSSS